MIRILTTLLLLAGITSGSLRAAGSSDLTESGTSLGNGWVNTTAFGPLYENPSGNGWHYSPGYGWIYPFGTDGAYWFYSTRIDWSYTSDTSAPHFYNQPLASWVWRDVAVSALDRVHDYSQGFTGTFAETFSPVVGTTMPLVTRFHEVGGDVEFVGMRRLRINNFIYDGAGIDVRAYLADSSGVTAPITIGEDLIRATPYAGETLEFSLPAPYSVKDFDYFSIWCVPVGASFGDLQY